MKWGISNTLTLNGAVHPDFAEVESDAGQFVFDPRQALFFPEKRPFFLEGLDQFNTPHNLIYTRRIVKPDVALKLTGKVAGTSIGVMSAADDQACPRPVRTERSTTSSAHSAISGDSRDSGWLIRTVSSVAITTVLVMSTAALSLARCTALRFRLPRASTKQAA